MVEVGSSLQLDPTYELCVEFLFVKHPAVRVRVVPGAEIGVRLVSGRQVKDHRGVEKGGSCFEAAAYSYPDKPGLIRMAATFLLTS